VTRLLDANRDARDVVEAVLGRERAVALGPLKRAEGGNLRPGRGLDAQLSAKFPVRHQSGRRHARGIKHGISSKLQ
jgi:hypothetical protein